MKYLLATKENKSDENDKKIIFSPESGCAGIDTSLMSHMFDSSHQNWKQKFCVYL